MKVRKIAKDESGAALIIATLFMVVLLGFAALTVDMGIKYIHESKIQTACDAAALAAASALPDTNRATELAKYYIEENGLDSNNVVITFLESNTQIKVEMIQDVDTTFANVLGISSQRVDVEAVAGVGAKRRKSAFDYAIFQGSNKNLSIGDGQQDIVGAVHSNGSMTVLNKTKVGGYSSVDGIAGADSLVNDNKYPSVLYVKDSDGNYQPYDVKKVGNKAYINQNGKDVDITPLLIKEEDEPIEMPMWLFDNLEGIIPTSLPEAPVTGAWKSISSPSDFDNYFSSMNASNNVHYTGNGSWGSLDSFNTDVFFDMPGRTLSISANYSATGNKMGKPDNPVNIYYNGGAGTQLAIDSYSGALEIYGNLYVDGNLKLAGNSLKVYGNIYCTGTVSFEGGAGLVISGDYLYCDTLAGGSAGISINGIILAEHNISLSGGPNNAVSENNNLSIISKHGDISFQAANTYCKGIVFAPEGKISTMGVLDFEGNIIGQELSITNGTLKVKPLTSDIGIDLNPGDAGAPIDSRPSLKG